MNDIDGYLTIRHRFKVCRDCNCLRVSDPGNVVYSVCALARLNIAERDGDVEAAKRTLARSYSDSYGRT